MTAWARTSIGSLRAALVLVLATAAASAQRSDLEIRRDVEFARGLVAKWGFTDLAELLLARLEHEAVPGPGAEEVELLRCELPSLSAARATEPTRRDELLKRALAAYEGFLSAHPESPSRGRAESELLEAAVGYGRSLAAAAEQSTSAEAAPIVVELQEVLTRVLARTARAADALRSPTARTEAEDRRLLELLLDRGTLFVLAARSLPDGSSPFELAKKTYEQVVDLAGETSAAGLRAHVGLGELYLAQGEPAEAADYFRFVAELAVPRDAKAWRAALAELLPDEVQRRFALLQIATPGLVQALLAAGNAAEACAEGLRFLDVWKREGLELVPPYGAQCLLAVADALEHAGGFVGGDLEAGTLEWFAGADALRARFPRAADQRTALELELVLAQQVLEEQRGNALGERARRMVDELSAQEGARLPPALLMDVVRARMNERDFLGAVAACKRVLAALDGADPAVRKEHGTRALNTLGRAYMALERPLEAALVFQEALASSGGDPELDALDARGFYNAASQLERLLPGDARIASLRAAAEQALVDHDQRGAGELAYANASRIYESEKDYAKARDAFRGVPREADSYEKALVYAGVCEYQLGKPVHDVEAAIRVFDDYLEHYVTDPAHALGPSDAARQARRGDAIATAVFYRGLAELDRAEAGRGDWQRVLELLGGYEDRFPEQTSFAPAAMVKVLEVHARLGHAREVEALYARLTERYPGSRWIAAAALDIYTALDGERQALATSKDPADAARSRELLRRMATALETANQGSAAPSFANLRRESQHWIELEEWAKAEALLLKLRAKFEAGPEAESVRKFVLPDLGLALYRQQKMQAAADVLEPLVAAKQATFEATRIFARALSGSAELVLEDGAKRMRVVPGIGGAAAFTRAAELFGKLCDTVKGREGAWTRAWLETKFDLIYCLSLQSRIDGKVAGLAKAQLRALQVEYGGDELPKLDDADLRAKFAWLATQVR